MIYQKQVMRLLILVNVSKKLSILQLRALRQKIHCVDYVVKQ